MQRYFTYRLGALDDLTRVLYRIYSSITRKILYQNTNAKFGARYKRGFRFLCLYARRHMSSGEHNKQVIRKRTSKYGIFRITCSSIAQGCKNLVVHSHCATNNLVKKKNFEPSLQNGSAPNFHSRYICVARRSVASASGCGFLEFDES